MLGLSRFNRSSRELETLKYELAMHRTQLEILRGVIAELDVDHLQIIAMRDALARVRALTTRWRAASMRSRDRTEYDKGYAEAQHELSAEVLAALAPASKEFT